MKGSGHFVMVALSLTELKMKNDITLRSLRVFKRFIGELTAAVAASGQ
jgi:hypothetical protein